MQVKKTLILKALVAVAALLPLASRAQTSTINAFSPYTMYGIGEVNTPGTLMQRSMGGIGVAMRNPGTLNLLNPASYSSMPQKSFLFSFGMEGQMNANYQTSTGGDEHHSNHRSINIHDIAFQLPLAKRLGLGFSLNPYSSVGYRVSFYEPFDMNNPLHGNVGPIGYVYNGEGDVTEVKLGVGWSPFKNVSFGVALQYFWGQLDRNFTASIINITGEGTTNSATGRDRYTISSFKGQAGVQWNAIMTQKRALTFGGVFEFGGDFNPEVSQTLYVSDLFSTSIKDETPKLALVLPHRVTVGALYQTTHWQLGIDYTYADWGGRNSVTQQTADTDFGQMTVAYCNTSTIKLGAEYTPSRYDVRSYMKRISYRAGFRYGDHNQQFGGRRISQYAVTAGIGFPIHFLGVTSIDVGVEYGRRGYNIAERIGLVRQQYFKFALGFSLFAGSENREYWFQRQKYD